MNVGLSSIILNPKSREDHVVSVASHLGIGSALFYLAPKIFEKLGGYHSFLGSGLVRYTSFAGGTALYFRAKWLNEQSSKFILPSTGEEDSTDNLAEQIKKMVTQDFLKINPFEFVERAREGVMQAKDNVEKNPQQDSQSAKEVYKNLNQALTYLNGLSEWFSRCEQQQQKKQNLMLRAMSGELSEKELSELLVQMDTLPTGSQQQTPTLKAEDVD